MRVLNNFYFILFTDVHIFDLFFSGRKFNKTTTFVIPNNTFFFQRGLELYEMLFLISVFRNSYIENSEIKYFRKKTKAEKMFILFF